MARTVPMPDWPPLMAEPLAAAYCGQMSEGTFRSVVLPECPPVQISVGRIAFAREDLDAWIARRRGRMPAYAEANPWDRK